MNKSCYLCGGTELKKRDGKVRDNESLDIFECKKCGLVFLSSFEHISDNFYQESNMHSDKEISIDEVLKSCETDDLRKYRQYEEVILNKDILDFGCGCGGFLLKAKKRAKSCCGIELERKYQEHYKKNHLEVFSSILDCDKKFDIIFMFHVVEHLINPVKIINDLKKHLKPNGRIIIETPNSEDALLTLYKNKGFKTFTYWGCHVFLYNQNTLGQLANKSGLTVDYVKQFQRYPLSNHLYWLSNDKPGVHQKWAFIDSQELKSSYESALAKVGKCDTVVGSFYE